MYPSFYLRFFHRVVWGRKPCLEKTPISPSKCCEHSLHLVCSILAFLWLFQAYLSSFTLSLLFSLATSFQRIFTTITRRVVKCCTSLPLLQIRCYWEHFLNFTEISNYRPLLYLNFGIMLIRWRDNQRLKNFISLRLLSVCNLCVYLKASRFLTAPLYIGKFVTYFF